MSKNYTDEQIMEGLLSRNERVCNAIATFFYDNYSRSITNLVLKNNGKIEDAEDLFQECINSFINQVWHNKFRLQTDTKISTYFYAIAHKKWLKKLERNGKKMNWEVEFASNYLFQGQETPIDVIIENEALENARYTFNKLGELCKAVLTAFYAEKKSMEEIAKLFGFTNADTAKVRKYRCMKEFGKSLIRK